MNMRHGLVGAYMNCDTGWEVLFNGYELVHARVNHISIGTYSCIDAMTPQARSP